MTTRNEIEGDAEGGSSSANSNARRRVDAYHETLREQNALRELEQPFIDLQSWPPRRY